MYSTIVSAEEAKKHANNDDWLFVDCRFFLDDTEKGLLDFKESHIPGAVYAHLNRDLSGLIIRGKTGRHPLPEQHNLIKRFSDWGISKDTQVVAYDEHDGSMAAARLWWLLKWAGHEAVAVLDGGFSNWTKSGYATSDETRKRVPKKFVAQFHPE